MGRMSRPLKQNTRRREAAARGWTAALALALLSWAPPAEASFLPPEVEDSLANFLAIFVLVFVPIVLIVLFWLVHILPEKIAHKRQHPQFEAIRTLCLLSLVFGGLLWPLAWIWAYTKPSLYKMAYGRDTVPHDEPYAGEAGPPDAAALALHQRLASLEGHVPESELAALRRQLDALETKFGPHGAR